MKTYTTQEMMRMTSNLGGWKNVARLGDDPAWVEAPPPESVDLNRETIFGYDAIEFMNQQYK